MERHEYPLGFCLYAFDLTPDLSANDDSHWNLIKHGCVRIDVRFSQDVENILNLILYAEMENILEIDSSRQCIVDFSG